MHSLLPWVCGPSRLISQGEAFRFGFKTQSRQHLFRQVLPTHTYGSRILLSSGTPLCKLPHPSVPPVSSSRVLTWLSAWHREVSSKRGPSSRMNGAEIVVIERQLPAPASGAEAWTLNSKGAQDSGENRRLQRIAAARGLLQLMHQRTARRRTRTGPWNPGRPPTG